MVTGGVVQANVGGTPTPSANGGTMTPSGRYLLFTQTGKDLYRRDLATNTSTLVSVAPDGTPFDLEDGRRIDPQSISDDGRMVTFVTVTFGRPPVDDQAYLRDIVAGTTTQLSTVGSSSHRSFVSGDGKHVVTWTGCPHSCAYPLAAVDLAAPSYPFGDGLLYVVPTSLSANGRYILAADLLYDRLTGEELPLPGAGSRTLTSLSHDNRFATIVTKSSLVPGDKDTTWDVYIWDRANDELRRANIPTRGTGVEPRAVTISPNGNAVGMSLAGEPTVVPAAIPKLASARPSHDRGDQHVTVRIEGGFMRPTDWVGFGAGVTVESVRAGTRGSLVATVSIAADATPGLRTVTVSRSSPFGRMVGSCTCFRVR
jgi:hypothetical protein